MPIRVLLVDDHTMFREALCLMLAREPGEAEVVGELGNGRKFFKPWKTPAGRAGD
jgi:DNA-binding NarL/FixJ family response regulator